MTSSSGVRVDEAEANETGAVEGPVSDPDQRALKVAPASAAKDADARSDEPAVPVAASDRRAESDSGGGQAFLPAVVRASAEGWTCYACGGHVADRVARNIDFGLPIYACLECGLIQTDFVSDDELSSYYETQYSHSQGRTVNPTYTDYSNQRGKVQRDLVRDVTGRERFAAVLDYGAGAGGGARAFGEVADHVVVWDPDPEIRSTMAAASKADILGQDILFSGRFDGHFDCIVLSHVLEHMSDPRAELARLNRLLAKDGILFVEVPFESGEVLRLMADQLKTGVGHVFHFNRHTLSDMLEADGYFKVEAIEQCGPSVDAFFRDGAALDLSVGENESGVWLRAVARKIEEAPSRISPSREADAEMALRRFQALSGISDENVRLRQLLRRIFQNLNKISGVGARALPAKVRSENLPEEAVGDLLEGVHVAFENARKRIQALDAARKKAEADGHASATALKSGLEKAATAFGAELRTHAEEATKGRAAAEAEVLRLKKAYDALRRETEGTEKERIGLKEQLSKKDRRLATLNDDLARLERSSAATEWVIEQMNAEVARAEASASRSQEMAREAAQDRDRACDEERRVKNAYDDLQEKYDKLAVMYRSIEARERQSQHQLKKAKLSRHLTLKERATLRNELAKAHHEVAHLRGSNSFRLGYALMAPLRITRRLFS